MSERNLAQHDAAPSILTYYSTDLLAEMYAS